MALFDVLQLPFMQRALLAGVILALLLASLGVFATLRRMAFFGEGVAHASLAGLAIALLAGVAPLPVALLWAFLVAALMFIIEQRTTLPRDTVIGILFTASMSLGVVLMSLTEGYQPELFTFLFGSILAIRQADILVLATAATVILTGLVVFGRQLFLLCVNEDSARIAGIHTNVVTLLLYFALAAAMVLGVHMLGIILVSALLIIPPATGRLLATSLRSYVVLANVFAVAAVLVGLVLSAMLNLPSGASIVLVAAGVFGVATLFHRT